MAARNTHAMSPANTYMDPDASIREEKHEGKK